MAGIKEVAALAEVSAGTVSNVLNHPDLVTPVTRERVQRAIAELGWVRNESARQLRAGSSNTVALVVLDAANPFFVDVARGAEMEAERHGHLVITCNTQEDATREARYLTMLEEQRVRGVLLTPVSDEDRTLIHDVVQRGTPVVLVDRVSGDLGQCSVAVDDVLGGQLAGDHLRTLGHRRIAYVAGPAHLNQVSDRLLGLRSAFGAVDHQLEVVEVGALTSEQGSRAAEKIAGMSDERRPTAVFCSNDLVALGVMQGLIAHDISVPGQVALIGYDDIGYAASAVIPLTSVRQPREQLGRAAARLLLEEIDEGPDHKHRQVIFQPELVVRASTTRSSALE